jgi:hypothetical protein
VQQVSYAHNELLQYTGFFNVRRGWQSLNTGPRYYLRLVRRTVGCEFIHPAQPTDAPSSRRSSRSHFYTPGFPRGCIYIYIYNINKFKSNNIFKKLYIYSDMNKFLYINHHIIYLYIMHFLLCIYTKMCISIPFLCVLS